jgi:hypothetical protein
MNIQEKLAKTQRGAHTDDTLTPEERLQSAREEIKDLREPQKFDFIDGLNLAGGGAMGGATAHLIVEGLGDNIQDERVKIGLKVIGTTIGALAVYAAGRKSEEMYVEARIDDANHELTQAQNDVIIANQQEAKEARNAALTERKQMMEKYNPLFEEANNRLLENELIGSIDTKQTELAGKSIAVKEAGQNVTINL